MELRRLEISCQFLYFETVRIFLNVLLRLRDACICHVGVIVMMFLGLNCDNLCFYFYKKKKKKIFTAIILPSFFSDLTSFFFRIILGKILLVFLCRIMSAISSQRRVRQRIE
jgi:hypothetical protein